jgi:5-methylthioadenosine/S-adenosylhomocysteine deaminase
MEYTRKFIERWKDHPLIVPAVAPHAPYTCTDDILQKASDLAVEYDVPLHIHLAETQSEVENSRSEHGMPVIPYVKKQNIFKAKVIAAHCVHIDPGEIRTLKNVNAGVAHNPSSNLKLASGIAPVKHMLDVGLNVGIGTDGTASNNDLDMFEEIRLTTFLAKGTSGDPTTLPAKQTLNMATRMGAKAIHLDEITGSLEAGKRADLILISLSSTHNSPFFRHHPDAVYSQVVYAAKATDVSDVMINGKWVMRAHQLLTLDETQLLLEAQQYAEKIDAFLLKRESSVLSKLIAIGSAMEEESFEVQLKVKITDPDEMIERIKKSDLDVIRKRHYREYDTYFFFEDAEQGRLRYREDHFISERNEITNVRSRLTLIGLKRDQSNQDKVMLSRSRYLAPATQSLRFYKEYFNPTISQEINKDRKRFLVNFKDTEFFINVDQFMEPALGSFLEIKSRTWSRKDAELKTKLTVELMEYLGADEIQPIALDYIELLKKLEY